jgi:hypothetical protein
MVPRMEEVQSRARLFRPIYADYIFPENPPNLQLTAGRTCFEMSNPLGTRGVTLNGI